MGAALVPKFVRSIALNLPVFCLQFFMEIYIKSKYTWWAYLNVGCKMCNIAFQLVKRSILFFVVKKVIDHYF